MVAGDLIQNIGIAPTSLSPRHQLPSPPGNFTGRDEIVDELVRQLTADGAGGAAISGLQGMGGVGKTALATVLAHRLKDRYPDAQLFLNLRGADPHKRTPVTPAEAMQNVIHVFHPDARLPETVEELAPLYRGALAQAGRVLLLLDNAAGAEQVRPLLPPPDCLLLITSRTQFNLPGLTARRIDCLAPKKSCELLLRLAPRLAGSEDEAAALCGHLPLALEVFAGAVSDKSLTPVAELLARLRERKDRLNEVDAAFEVSAGLLDEALRLDWLRLAVFPASFDLRAAAAVWARDAETARESMQSLVRANLVEWNETTGRFRLHDLVREFCDRGLDASEQDTARIRHAVHYRDVGAETNALYVKGGENVRRGLELFDRERAQIEAVFAWLQSRRDHDSATLIGALCNAVAYVGSLRFHPRQRIRWLEAHRDAARLVGDRHGESAALGNLGNAHFALGDAHKAIEFHEQHLIIAREIGNRRSEGLALGNLGNAHSALDDTRKAIEFYEQTLLIAREIGDRRSEGNTLGNLGIAHSDQGDACKATEFYEQHLLIAREIGDRRGEGNALGNLGNAHSALGDSRKAIEFYEQRLLVAREIGDRRGEGNALWNSADEFWDLGEKPEAIRRAEEALRIREEIEDPNTIKVRATLARWRGETK